MKTERRSISSAISMLPRSIYCAVGTQGRKAPIPLGRAGRLCGADKAQMEALPCPALAQLWGLRTAPPHGSGAFCGFGFQLEASRVCIPPRRSRQDFREGMLDWAPLSRPCPQAPEQGEWGPSRAPDVSQCHLLRVWRDPCALWLLGPLLYRVSAPGDLCNLLYTYSWHLQLGPWCLKSQGKVDLALCSPWTPAPSQLSQTSAWARSYRPPGSSPRFLGSWAPSVLLALSMRTVPQDNVCTQLLEKASCTWSPSSCPVSNSLCPSARAQTLWVPAGL